MQLSYAPTADDGTGLSNLGLHKLSAYAAVESSTYDAENSASATAGIQQAFIQIDNLVFGTMETAFADNDALPPTLDLAGPNSRVTVLQQGGTVMGQGRLSYFLHQMPQKTAGFGYAINASVEQPIPEIAANPSPPKPIPPAPPQQPATTFARFPDLIGTFKIGEMLESPDDLNAGTDPTKAQYYEAWHIQAGGLVRSLGLEWGNDAIDESAFGWGVSLSGHFTFFQPFSTLPDAFYGSATYGVGIAHYINDLHTLTANAATMGNDAVLDGTYLKALPDLGYYAGYLHNWADHWRSVVSYGHATLYSEGQSLSKMGTLYRFGDYVSANIEWHRTVQAPDPTKPPQQNGQPADTDYAFNIGIEYLYGRFEELSGAAGQDQRISLVASIYK